MLIEKKSETALGMDYIWDMLDQSFCQLLSPIGLWCCSAGDDPYPWHR
jgi:hypothetical protein